MTPLLIEIFDSDKKEQIDIKRALDRCPFFHKTSKDDKNKQQPPNALWVIQVYFKKFHKLKKYNLDPMSLSDKPIKFKHKFTNYGYSVLLLYNSPMGNF